MLERVWRKGNPLTLLVGMQTGTTTVENSVEIPLKTGTRTAILLDIYSEETRVERDTHIPVFIAALFAVARTWKQPRCPLSEEWIRKLWYIYTMECYSAMKRNTFESVLMRWMNLGPIIHSEISQKEKKNTVY